MNNHLSFVERAGKHFFGNGGARLIREFGKRSFFHLKRKFSPFFSFSQKKDHSRWIPLINSCPTKKYEGCKKND